MTTGEMLRFTNYLKGVKQSKYPAFTKLKCYYSLLAHLEKLYGINAINKNEFKHSDPILYRLQQTVRDELDVIKEMKFERR